MDDSLAVRVASVPVTTVTGSWLRHAFAAYPERALEGRVYDGRWSTKPGYPVLYLGRLLDSVVVEAYRHLVDPVEDPALLAQIHPRILVTARVNASNVLDLRTAGAVGLTLADLRSDIADYAPCQQVSQVAHQLRRHGILAPAATGLGEPSPCSAISPMLPARSRSGAATTCSGRRCRPTRGSLVPRPGSRSSGTPTS